MIVINLAIVILSFFNAPELAQNVEVRVTGIRNNKGFIVISVFKDQSTFAKERPLFTKKFDKKEMQNNMLLAKFHLEEGHYGFALLDDENNNAQMEYSFLGIPEEGFGFSDYYHTGFTRPKFESFKLEITKQVVHKSTIKIRYM